jgi:hypothetical protein
MRHPSCRGGLGEKNTDTSRFDFHIELSTAFATADLLLHYILWLRHRKAPHIDVPV